MTRSALTTAVLLSALPRISPLQWSPCRATIASRPLSRSLLAQRRGAEVVVRAEPARDDQQAVVEWGSQRAAAVELLPLYAALVVGLPLLAQLFPPLLSTLLAGPASPAFHYRSELLLVLLAGKRAFLYLMSFTIVAIASLRASRDSALLGTRLKLLTNEVFYSFRPPAEQAEAQEQLTLLQTTLDDVAGEQQVIALPVLVVSSLAFSVLLLQLPSLLQATADAGSVSADVGLALADTVASSVKASNAAVCVLFTRSELANALLAAGFCGPVTDETSMTAEEAKLLWASLALSSAVVAAAFLGPPATVWPAQNLVNMCLAVTVARAVQLPRLALVLAVLVALTAYDIVGVLATSTTPLASVAATAGASASASAATAKSAMASVALAKASGSWQPGLLAVLLQGRVSDLLGLGDAVFPAILATWATRFDADVDNGRGYRAVSLGGYVAGLAACEWFYPTQGGTGQPALLYIAPCMAAAVVGWAAWRGELDEALAFGDTMEEESTGQSE